jgi:uncharacterized membrane protein YkgB
MGYYLFAHCARYRIFVVWRTETSRSKSGGELLEKTWDFFPTAMFIIVLGMIEVIIGIGLLAKKYLRTILGLLWLQMLGTLITPILAPDIFFSHNIPLLLTLEGEFIVKNFVLIAAGIVIGGYEVEN